MIAEQKGQRPAPMNATISRETQCAGSLRRMVRRFARRPGPGWKHLAGSVWEHTTGLRVHMLGMARLPDGQVLPWRWQDEYDAKRQQGYNTKRALMVWALSLLSPNVELETRVNGSLPFAALTGSAKL